MHTAHNGPVELRLPIAGTDGPSAHPEPGGVVLVVALSGGACAQLVLPTWLARRWAAKACTELYSACLAAGGPDSPDEAVAVLPAREEGHPVLRFYLSLDVSGEDLAPEALRCALAAELSRRPGAARVSVSEAFVVVGSGN